MMARAVWRARRRIHDEAPSEIAGVVQLLLPCPARRLCFAPSTVIVLVPVRSLFFYLLHDRLSAAAAWLVRSLRRHVQQLRCCQRRWKHTGRLLEGLQEGLQYQAGLGSYSNSRFSGTNNPTGLTRAGASGKLQFFVSCCLSGIHGRLDAGRLCHIESGVCRLATSASDLSPAGSSIRAVLSWQPGAERARASASASARVWAGLGSA